MPVLIPTDKMFNLFVKTYDMFSFFGIIYTFLSCFVVFGALKFIAFIAESRFLYYSILTADFPLDLAI